MAGIAKLTKFGKTLWKGLTYLPKKAHALQEPFVAPAGGKLSIGKKLANAALKTTNIASAVGIVGGTGLGIYECYKIYNAQTHSEAEEHILKSFKYLDTAVGGIVGLLLGGPIGALALGAAAYFTPKDIIFGAVPACRHNGKYISVNELRQQKAAEAKQAQETQKTEQKKEVKKEETPEVDKDKKTNEPEDVEPQDSTVVAPHDSIQARPIAPTDSTVVAPQDSTIVTPHDSIPARPIAPTDSTVVAPQDSTVVAPHDSIQARPIAPTDSTVVAPQDSTIVTPRDSIPARPIAPNDSTVVAPQDSTIVTPRDSIPARPIAPNDSTVVAPQDSTIVTPHDSIQARPIAPNDSSNVAPPVVKTPVNDQNKNEEHVQQQTPPANNLFGGEINEITKKNVKIQKGDCLWNIAKRELQAVNPGKTITNAQILKQVKEFGRLNTNIKNLDLIYPEDNLKLTA